MPRPKKPVIIEEEHEEEEEEVPSSFTVTELKPENAVDDNYVYLRVHKVWGQVQLLGEFPLKTGVTLMEPYSMQIVVAWLRPNGNMQVDPRPGTIRWSEWEKLVQSMEAVQQRALGRVYASEATKSEQGF